MKKTMIVLFASIALVAFKANAQITLKERSDAINSLTLTREEVLNAVKNLSAAQLKYKASPEKWSIEECTKHIASAEKQLWKMVEASLQQPVDSAKRAGIKFTDAELVAAVKDRSHKSKTFAALEPANAPYQSVDEAISSFLSDRKKLISYVKTTKADLRNHVSELPIGTYDAYQFILLISAHTDRHVQQIREVMATANFPR